MIFSFFTDPILRAPTLGCMLMGLSAALMGALAFVKKRSLLGEALSHAAYPGVIFGALCAGMIGLAIDAPLSLFSSFLGALLCAFLGLISLEWLERRGRVKNDAALCYLLASFFGVGVLAASTLQGAFPLFAKQAQLYLYGQAATMTDLHLLIYAALSLVVVSFLLLFFRPLQALLFDRACLKAMQIPSTLLMGVLLLLFLFSIIIGIRSVGVILMSGMLIAPAVAARAWTDRFSLFLVFSGLFGALSGLLGAILSTLFAISLPTGPLIICIGAAIALLSLLFAPKRGVLGRVIRIALFRWRCVEENILKSVWKKGTIPLADLREMHHLNSFFFHGVIRKLFRKGLIQPGISLSALGMVRATHIVRLHRLWEVYLADLGWPVDQVHQSAEEMEHILTPEFEERLAQQLHHPTVDPHEQPIPGKL